MGQDQKSGGLKWIIILALLAAGGGGAYYFLHHQQTPKLEFTTAPVNRGEVIQAVTATGTLNPVLNVQVGSQISGIIQSLHADFNTVVKSNQIIAQLDASTYRANVNSAEGELANSKASLELARINARRATELFSEKLISQSDFDQSQATLQQAEAQVRIRTATVERARVDLGRCTIYAPVDGIVIDRKVDVGQTVAASLSAPVLFQIANDLTKMQINAAVSEADVGSVEVGQPVEFSVDAFPLRKFRGEVTQVRNSPITVQNVVTYDTIISVNNDDLKLKPGMTANVSIIVARREAALTVPNSVLRFRPPEGLNASSNSPNGSGNTNLASAPTGEPRRGGGERGPGNRGGGGGRSRGEPRPTRTLYTLAADPAKAQLTDLKPAQVKLGISDGIVTEVIEGLAENDQVVISVNTGSAPGGTTPAVNNPFGGGFPRR